MCRPSPLKGRGLPVPFGTRGPLKIWESAAGDGSADAVELGAGRLAEERHGEDAHDGDEGHEERVLDERSATLAVDLALQPRAQELVRGHLGNLPFSCVNGAQPVR